MAGGLLSEEAGRGFDCLLAVDMSHNLTVFFSLSIDSLFFLFIGMKMNPRLLLILHFNVGLRLEVKSQDFNRRCFEFFLLDPLDCIDCDVDQHSNYNEAHHAKQAKL